MSLSTFRRTGPWRVALLLAIGAFVLAVQPYVSASAGREFSRCIQSCNDVRKECGSACVEDCKALFPGDTAAITACVAACKDICNFESAECKEACEAIKEPPSPEEP